jgi:uncharacterized protein (DUF1778 family)
VSRDAREKSHARIELPPAQMQRVKRAAKLIGLGVSAFIRQAALEKAVEVERRMDRSTS